MKPVKSELIFIEKVAEFPKDDRGFISVSMRTENGKKFKVSVMKDDRTLAVAVDEGKHERLYTLSFEFVEFILGLMRGGRLGGNDGLRLYEVRDAECRRMIDKVYRGQDEWIKSETGGSFCIGCGREKRTSGGCCDQCLESDVKTILGRWICRKEVEICEWCGNSVSDGLTHGEGKCFDADTGEPLR